MNIDIINQAIQELEVAEETIENIEELAALYVVRENLLSSGNSYSSHTVSLPYYEKYISSKRRYQLKQTTEGEVIRDVKNTCQELKDLVCTLYANTDMNKERLCLKQMIQELFEKFCE